MLPQYVLLGAADIVGAMPNFSGCGSALGGSFANIGSAASLCVCSALQSHIRCSTVCLVRFLQCWHV